MLHMEGRRPGGILGVRYNPTKRTPDPGSSKSPPLGNRLLRRRQGGGLAVLRPLNRVFHVFGLQRNMLKPFWVNARSLTLIGARATPAPAAGRTWPFSRCESLLKHLPRRKFAPTQCRRFRGLSPRFACHLAVKTHSLSPDYMPGKNSMERTRVFDFECLSLVLKAERHVSKRLVGRKKSTSPSRSDPDSDGILSTLVDCRHGSRVRRGLQVRT